MHAMLDFDMLLPHYVLITDGKKGDNTAAKQIPVERGTVVVSDRYYCDFELLNPWNSNGVFFVVRHKSNLAFRKVRENDLPPARHQNVLIDEIVELTASLRLNTFTKMDLWKWLDEPFTPPPDTPGNPNEGVQFSDFSPAIALFVGE